MVHFSLYAFVPFAVLLGIAGIAGGLCAWIEFAARGVPRRKVPMRSAQILVFPVGKATQRPALSARKAG